jgi:hypothetical protein
VAHVLVEKSGNYNSQNVEVSMKKNKFYLMIFLITAWLSGCGPVYQTSYTYQPPTSQVGRMCISQCMQTKSSCEQMCQMQDQNCRMMARQNAFYQYQQYRDYQTSHGLSVDRNLNDFDNSFFECRKSCHCSADFNFCYQNCGGVVQEHKVCTAFCDQR